MIDIIIIFALTVCLSLLIYTGKKAKLNNVDGKDYSLLYSFCIGAMFVLAIALGIVDYNLGYKKGQEDYQKGFIKYPTTQIIEGAR